MILYMLKPNAPQEFVAWLEDWQKRENWSGVTEMAREIGISHPSLIGIMSHGKQPSYSVCLAIAKRARVSPEFVLRLAGLLPDNENANQEVEEMVGVFSQLPHEEQKRMIEIAKTLLAFQYKLKQRIMGE